MRTKFNPYKRRASNAKLTLAEPRDIIVVDTPLDFLGLAEVDLPTTSIGVVCPKHTLIAVPKVGKMPKFEDYATAFACCKTIIVQGTKYKSRAIDNVTFIG